jgi:hypothetical protein
MPILKYVKCTEKGVATYGIVKTIQGKAYKIDPEHERLANAAGWETVGRGMYYLYVRHTDGKP